MLPSADNRNEHLSIEIFHHGVIEPPRLTKYALEAFLFLNLRAIFTPYMPPGSVRFSPVWLDKSKQSLCNGRYQTFTKDLPSRLTMDGSIAMVAPTPNNLLLAMGC